MVNVTEDLDIEEQREVWALIARENGWYTEPFYVQVWVDKQGNVLDSVSWRGIDRDYVVPPEEA